jgi:FkbM family methyltransferase
MPECGPEKWVTTLASNLDPPLTVVDVGSRGGIDGTWLALRPHLRAFGFDADSDECDRLARLYGSDRMTFVPLALGATPGTRRLYVTADPACSSLFPPLPNTRRLYAALEVTAPVTTRLVPVDTLDNWGDREGVVPISFLKLDTQGSELEILEGATRSLRSVVAVRTEIEFNPIYAEQPLFGDIDRFLRQHGFVLWRLLHLCHYHPAGRRRLSFTDEQVFAATPTDVRTASFEASSGQLFWGEAFFVRREVADGQAPADPDDWARVACVLAMLGFYDLVSTRQADVK